MLVRDYVAVSGYKRCMMQEGYTEGGFWKGQSDGGTSDARGVDPCEPQGK